MRILLNIDEIQEQQCRGNKQLEDPSPLIDRIDLDGAPLLDKTDDKVRHTRTRDDVANAVTEDTPDGMQPILTPSQL